MKLHELDQIASERGLRSVLNALWFGSKGALLATAANFEQINNTCKQLRNAGYEDRADTIMNSVRYQTLEQRAHEAADRAAAIHAYAEAKGHVVEVDFTPEYQRGKDNKQLEAAAEASGVDIDVIKEKERKSIESRYAAQLYAKMQAEALFWSAAGADVDSVEIKTETVLNSLIRQRDYMLEWSNLDLGELTLLKHDIGYVTHVLDLEEQRGDPSEGSIDEGVVVQTSMSDMNKAFQKEIADTRKARERDEDEPAALHAAVTQDGFCEILAANKPVGKGGRCGDETPPPKRNLRKAPPPVVA